MSKVDWDKNWRGAGIQAAVLFLIAYGVFGGQPKVGASAAELVSFYDGHRTRILIATVILGFAILALLWFVTVLASVLRDAGKGGWGNAALAGGAAYGTILFVHTTLNAALAYSVAGSGNHSFASGLNDLSWALMTLGWFPAAMLIMAGSFGLWRAGLFSTRQFAAGVTAMAVLLAGTTTWAVNGFWSADGVFAHFVVAFVMLAWVVGVSRFLVKRVASTVSTPDRAAVPAM